MNETRDKILARLRSAKPAVAPLERRYPRHDWPREELVRRFSERLRAVRAEIHEASHDDWPQRLHKLARERSLSNLMFAPNTSWGWQLRAFRADNRIDIPDPVVFDKAIEHRKKDLFFYVEAALTSSLGGIAETGTVVLWPNPEEPRSMSLVPPVHFVLLETKRLYSTFAQLVREQNWTAGMPSNALLISGPSKTADIEQTLAYGVHGPKELIVLLIED